MAAEESRRRAQLIRDEILKRQWEQDSADLAAVSSPHGAARKGGREGRVCSEQKRTEWGCCVCVCVCVCEREREREREIEREINPPWVFNSG